jgi:hypothetical protein
MSEYLYKSKILSSSLVSGKLRDMVIGAEFDVEDGDIDFDIARLRKYISGLVTALIDGSEVGSTEMKNASDTLSQLMKLKESLGKQDKIKRVSEMGEKVIDDSFTGLGE